MTDPMDRGGRGLPARQRTRRPRGLPSWRREELRTSLWLVPALLVGVAAVLFLVTYELDLAVYHGKLSLPWWIRKGSADAGRQVLSAIAASVITVVGVVFSITVLALTLASQQFGPRMMRNFVRDRGNQVTLGVWVATFVYSVLALGSITSFPHGPDFVPYISITVSEILLVVDVLVLIYFIHHVAKSIQLPEVIAGVARDLISAVDAEFPDGTDHTGVTGAEDAGTARSVTDLLLLLEEEGVTVPATRSGYLQFVGYGQLVAIAERTDSVIRLAHRPGHFVVEGRALATVWPPASAVQVARALAQTHVTGPHRTLMQDPVFAIDQLVEICIRALSPAVNDTFTALTCIDWLSAGLCRISTRTLAEGVYRDRTGAVRLIEFDPSYARMVNRAFDKIRQCAGHMPAVVIRLVDSLAHIMEYTTNPEQRVVLVRQADMILRAAEESITEEDDLIDIRSRHAQVLFIRAHRDGNHRADARTPRRPARSGPTGPS